jgi:hypothetical protein
MKDVLDKDLDFAGVLPSCVVVHKTSLYQPEEEADFRGTAEDRVPVCDLIWMRSTAFRLIRKGTQEPWRGTLCTIGTSHTGSPAVTCRGGTNIPVPIFRRRFRLARAGQLMSVSAPGRFWR